MPVATNPRRNETEAERRHRQRAEEDARREQAFHRARRSHATYERQLRALARHVSHIVHAFAPDDPNTPWTETQKLALVKACREYGEAITPWARSVATKMLAQVNRSNQTAWRNYAGEMSAALRAELLNTPVGPAIDDLMAEQVDLITSLPWDMARRVQEKSLQAMETSERYPERQAEIEEYLAATHPEASRQWLATRATLIARTETARAHSVLTQARATHIGADTYIWKTAGDWKVRESHKKLNGTAHSWDKPPLSDPPDHYSHPGQIWNCRCLALPVLPD